MMNKASDARVRNNGWLDGRRERSQCTVHGCKAVMLARGYCSRHYNSWRKRGHPLASSVTNYFVAITDTVAHVPLRNRTGEIVDYAIVDMIDAEWLSRWRWSKSPNGYAYRVGRVAHTGCGQTVLMARAILDALDDPPHVQIDHINRQRLDNRRANLRRVTARENTHNSTVTKLNSERARAIRQIMSQGARIGEVARQFSVSVDTVRGVVNGKFWKEAQ